MVSWETGVIIFDSCYEWDTLSKVIQMAGVQLREILMIKLIVSITNTASVSWICFPQRSTNPGVYITLQSLSYCLDLPLHMG